MTLRAIDGRLLPWAICATVAAGSAGCLAIDATVGGEAPPPLDEPPAEDEDDDRVVHDGTESGFRDIPPLGDTVVWPISGSLEADRLASPFGPRIQGSIDDYDFHRGIDMRVPIGTTVHAVASGVVLIAGSDERYPDLLVQVAHCADAIPPPQPWACQQPFYTNYMHLSQVDAEVGQTVESGQPIGLSGAPASGNEHLHFEVRFGGTWQQHAIHPLRILPRPDHTAPDLTFDSIDFENTIDSPRVEVTVTRPAEELDWIRVDAEIYDRASDSLVVSQSYDSEAWNYQFTELEDPNVKLDNPWFNGISVYPEPFSYATSTYEIRFGFRNMDIDIPPDDVRLVVRAFDIDGRMTAYQCHPCN